MKRTLPGNNLSDEENSNKKPDKSLWRLFVHLIDYIGY